MAGKIPIINDLAYKLSNHFHSSECPKSALPEHFAYGKKNVR